MRKNDVRKWIHAGLDLLPLLIIPIFALAVRSDNNFQPIEVNYGGGYEVSERFETNDINSVNDFVVGNIYTMRLDDVLQPSSTYFDFAFYICNCDYLYLNSQELDEISVDDYDINFNNFIIVNYYEDSVGVTFSNNNGYAYIISDYLEFGTVDLYFKYQSDLDSFVNYFTNTYDVYIQEYFYASDFNVLDATYHEGVVYNDTDVGSQMVYTLYNACDKYFNFNNVFNFNQIYDWLELNIFHGTAPMSIFIAWNIFLYEFLMDLIFLLYALFMFFVDFCSNLIDRFHTKCSGGK